MDISSLATLQKQSKKSFNDQKALIKKVLAGKKVNCTKCQQPLSFVVANEQAGAKICCSTGCTDIELDVS